MFLEHIPRAILQCIILAKSLTEQNLIIKLIIIMKGMTDWKKMVDFSKLIIRTLRNFGYCEMH